MSSVEEARLAPLTDDPRGSAGKQQGARSAPERSNPGPPVTGTATRAPDAMFAPRRPGPREALMPVKDALPSRT